jgi:ribonuclease E
MSIIARTAGIGRSAPELQWDLNYLLKLWTAIDGAAKGGKGAYLIYQESSLVIRAIRDYFNSDIGEILIDTDDIFEQAHQFMNHVMPEHGHRVKRYRDDAPLFSRFQIEHQIETAYARTVQLPSGGAIVIDQTEALVAVDVNSARAIKGGDIEETATRTNLEAADEVARQARLRDLGGLIVIDFIDMEESKNRREVENRLRDALRQDRARVQFGAISKFGLLEMSRQRLRPTLSEGASIPCPRCGGSGHIRDTESSALQILRIIQEESLKDNTSAVLAQVPVEVASFLLNEKRTEITKIELKQRINVLLVPNKGLDTPNYKLERLKHDDPRLENLDASYKLADEADEATTFTRRSQERSNKQEPIIKGVLPDGPAPTTPTKTPTPQASPSPKESAPVSAPVAAPAGTGGFFGWLKRLLGGGAEPTPQTQVPAAAAIQADAGTPVNALGAGKENGRSGSSRPENRGGREGGRNSLSSARGRHSETRDERSEVKSDGRAPLQPNGLAEGNRPARSERQTENRNRGGRNERNIRNEATGPASALENVANVVAASGEQALTDNAADIRGNRRERGELRGEARGDGRKDRGARRDRRPEATGATTADTPADTIQTNSASTGEDEPRYSYFSTTPTAKSTDATVADAVTDTPKEAPPEIATSTSEDHVTGDAAPDSTSVPAREKRSRDRYGRDRRERNGSQPRSDITPEDQKSEGTANNIATSPRSPIEGRSQTNVTLPATEGFPIEAGLPSGMPKVKAYNLPQHELQTLAREAGLEWIGSDPEKVALAQSVIASTPAPVHVPRERKPVILAEEGPLILVETRKDLSSVTLPFDAETVQ